MKNKLILVEGFPGSGKTTTAKQIHKVMSKKGIPCMLFNEGNVDHPADLDIFC
jgi:thymidylate kinase